MLESPMLSHCSSRSLLKINFSHTYMYVLIREIYESGSVTALAVAATLTVESVVGVCAQYHR